jgi:phage shock protein C
MKRDLNGGMVFGVCAGAGTELGIDPALIRLAFVVLTLLGFGFPILIYLIAAVLMSGD